MQFQILLILLSVLIITFLWFINIVINYLRLAKLLMHLKQSIVNKILLLLDLNLSVRKQLNPQDSLTEVLAVKNLVWQSRKNSVNSMWIEFLVVFDDIKLLNSSLQTGSDLQIKVDSTLHSFYEILHSYNQEVLLIQKKEIKPFFKIINKLFLHINFDELVALGDF